MIEFENSSGRMKAEREREWVCVSKFRRTDGLMRHIHRPMKYSKHIHGEVGATGIRIVYLMFTNVICKNFLA